MAGDPFGKVGPGEEVTFNANVWNSFIDAARAESERQHSRTSQPSEILRQASIIKVKNSSGSNLTRNAILGISAPLFSPGSSLRAFQNEVRLVGVTPASSHAGKFVVLLDPIGIGKIGRAVVAGVVPVKVNILSTTHTSADVVAGSTANLTTVASGGSAQLLWQDTGTGVKWCVVRLGTKCP
jgi:hypothetical protein